MIGGMVLPHVGCAGAYVHYSCDFWGALQMNCAVYNIAAPPGELCFLRMLSGGENLVLSRCLNVFSFPVCASKRQQARI
jgi:hypothetical protein